MAKNSIMKIRRELATKKTSNSIAFNERLNALERKIGRTYAIAERDVEKQLNEYWHGAWHTDGVSKSWKTKGFIERDDEMRKGLMDGSIKVPAGSNLTPDEYYKLWRMNQIGRGKNLEVLRENLAQRVIKYNEVAYAYINDSTPGIYSLGWNYASHLIENHTGVMMRVINEQTVKRLIVESPQLMPYYPPEKAFRKGYNMQYTQKIITNTVTNGILTGKTIAQLTEELMHKVVGMNRTSAIRAARTASRCANNAGHLAAAKSAQEMGIDIMKQWLSIIDKRTRDSHKMMYGEIQLLDNTFSNGLMHPGDEANGDADPAEVYNCRCTMVDVIDGETIFDTHGEMTEEELILWARNRRIWKGDILE